MKEILVRCIFILMWGLEINADTYEVLTIPYDKIFPERNGQNGQHGHNYQRPGYQQQRPGYQQPQMPQYQRPGYQPSHPHYQQPSAGFSAADWVCRNPYTGDMLIISSDSLPFGNPQNPRQPQVPNVQPNQPVQTDQPQYPGQNQGSQTPSQNQNPFLPNSNQTPAPVPTSAATPINCNNYPQHPMCGEVIILGTTTTRVPETTPNTNGKGVIDVRMRGKYPSTKDKDPDRLVFSD